MQTPPIYIQKSIVFNDISVVLDGGEVASDKTVSAYVLAIF